MRIAAIACLCLVVLGGCALPESGGRSTRLTIAWNGETFDAVIDAPPPARRHGAGVLLIGGGFGNDLEWTTAGTIQQNGAEPVQLTISGGSHTDAPQLSRAFVAQGFVVMRWSTISREDPLAEQWPARATPRTLTELTSLSSAALDAFRSSGLVDPDRVLLLGHSLGAARACSIAAADTGIAGLILLAPAYFTRPDQPPASFEEQGLQYGAEVLQHRPIPTLVLAGALDTSRAVNVASLAKLRGAGTPPTVSIEIFEGLGHNLGPVDGGRTGPMDADVVRFAADWAANRFARP